MELVTATEIAERLGLADRHSVHNWRRRDLGFPEPAGRFGGVLVWQWADVEEWARATGRMG